MVLAGNEWTAVKRRIGSTPITSADMFVFWILGKDDLYEEGRNDSSWTDS